MLGQSSAGGCGATVAVPNPDPVDSDGDGFSDELEINSTPGTDPFDPTDNPNNVRNSDGDACSDYDELHFPNFCDNDPYTPPCPFVLDDGEGFAVTIPCGFVPVDESVLPIPGASYQSLYANASYLIMVAVFPTTQGAGSLPDDFGTFQLNGPVVTATGDFVLSENYQASGYEGERVTGLLANGNFLIIGVLGASYDQNVQLIAAALFLTVVLHDTDGSAYVDLLANVAHALSAPAVDAFVVLDDGSAWLAEAGDEAIAASWLAQDLILQTVSDYSFDDARFVNMRTWALIDVERCGSGSQHTVAAIEEPEFAARAIVLESGATLESSYADENKLLDWFVDDPVSVIAGATCLIWSTYVVNLRTGSTVGIP